VPFAAFLRQSAGACDTDILGAGVTEVLAMDPQHRVLVEHCFHAMAVAPPRLVGGRGGTGGGAAAAEVVSALHGAGGTSVFAGCMWSEYAEVLSVNLGVDLGAGVSTGTGVSFMAGRVSCRACSHTAPPHTPSAPSLSTPHTPLTPFRSTHN